MKSCDKKEYHGMRPPPKEKAGGITPVDGPNLTAARVFSTGAFRNNDKYKDDYEGYLSPLVIEAFGKYMTRSRRLEDGQFRSSDNWQKGIPDEVYMKSLWRHFLSAWKQHRGYSDEEPLEDALCAIIFNAMGRLHNLKLKTPSIKWDNRPDYRDPADGLNDLERKYAGIPHVDPVEYKVTPDHVL